MELLRAPNTLTILCYSWTKHKKRNKINLSCVQQDPNISRLFFCVVCVVAVALGSGRYITIYCLGLCHKNRWKWKEISGLFQESIQPLRSQVKRQHKFIFIPSFNHRTVCLIPSRCAVSRRSAVSWQPVVACTVRVRTRLASHSLTVQDKGLFLNSFRKKEQNSLLLCVFQLYFSCSTYSTCSTICGLGCSIFLSLFSNFA